MELNRKTCVEFALMECWDTDLDFIKTIAPNVIGTHCAIYQQALAASTSPSGLKQIMSCYSNSKFYKIQCFKFKNFQQNVPQNGC
jgi:hypothetical protein